MEKRQVVDDCVKVQMVLFSPARDLQITNPPTGVAAEHYD
jgi:hypothetical protein